MHAIARRPRVLGALAAAGAIAVGVWSAGGVSGAGSANASVGSAMALYGALKWQGPAGMALPASPTGDSPGGNRPSFPTNPPAEPGAAERWPIASTIRPVSLEVAGVSAWIAEAYGGGVCVLVSAQGTNGAVGFSCSTRQMLSRGTGLELPDLPASPGKVLKVGVVPNATRAMAVGLVGGRTATASVSDNAWAYLADDGSVVPGSTSPIGG